MEFENIITLLEQLTTINIERDNMNDEKKTFVVEISIYLC